jgi:hypothetical protein
MPKAEYMELAWDINTCDKYSFRGLISEKYSLKNINFAVGASSNQRQFRLLKNFLHSEEGKKLQDTYSTVIVLHGITSTARADMYLADYGKMTNFKFDDPKFEKYSKSMLEHFYDHDNEVELLEDEMSFMNQFYKFAGIKNLWFDTFNHYNYSKQIDNMIQGWPSRDLLTTMAIKEGLEESDHKYHRSSWLIDTNRVKFLVDEGFLNPHSFHPTKQGHELIANILDEYIVKLLQE